MELGALAAALVRRWYLVIAALALAAGACVLTVSSVGPTYTTQASVLLFPPAADDGPAGEQTAANPYLELGGLTTARDILIRTLTSQSQRDEIAEVHPDADYALTPDTTSAGPIVVVEVVAPSAREALAAQDTLLSGFPGALEDLQEGLGLTRAEFITARELTVDDRAEVLHKSQVRAAIVAVAGVLLLALGLIGLVDGWLATRPRPRTAGGHEPRDAEEGEEGEEGEEASSEPAAGPEPEDATQTPQAAAPARITHKKARKQARRSARDDAVRAAREGSRDLDRASA